MEYKEIEMMLTKSLKKAILRAVVRIKNTWLLHSYEMEKKMMAFKNSRTINEKLLFHSTRETDPELIFKGEVGFDMRFSKQGRWGFANFFAEDAEYSHQFALETSGGMKQILLARVLTGNSYPGFIPDNSLTLPPIFAKDYVINGLDLKK